MSIESLLIPKSSAPHHYLKSLDSQIENILNNKALPSDVKYNLYSQVINKYTDVRENMQKPTKVTVNKISEPQQVYDLYENIPKNMHKKVKKLINFINSLENVSITPNGAVNIDGHELRNSNISDIVTDFIMNKKSRPPVGAKQLALEMKLNNVPLNIINNKNRLAWFDENKSPEVFNNQWSHY